MNELVISVPIFEPLDCITLPEFVNFFISIVMKRRDINRYLSFRYFATDHNYKHSVNLCLLIVIKEESNSTLEKNSTRTSPLRVCAVWKKSLTIGDY